MILKYNKILGKGCRMSTSIKYACVVMDNTGPGGSLNTDKVSVALLQYYNTPLRDINLSPAQLATGRQLRDGVPADRQHYKVNCN